MANLRKLKIHVLVCAHKHCQTRGGREAAKSLKRGRAYPDEGVLPPSYCPAEAPPARGPGAADGWDVSERCSNCGEELAPALPVG